MEKPPITVQAKLISEDVLEEIYEASLEVPADFGDIGAVIVENHNEKEMFVKEVELNGLASGPLIVTCNSWVQPKTLVPTQNRVFFTDKVCHPLSTHLTHFPHHLTQFTFSGHSHTCHRRRRLGLDP